MEVQAGAGGFVDSAIPVRARWGRSEYCGGALGISPELVMNFRAAALSGGESVAAGLRRFTAFVDLPHPYPTPIPPAFWEQIPLHVGVRARERLQK